MNRFITRMTDDEQILRGAAGLFNASEQVTRGEWHQYATSLSLEKNYPGFQGLGFTEVVHPKDRERHIRRVRAEGFPSYRIWPEGEREVYTAIVYLEPFDWRNRRAFGYDMFSEPVRHEAMEKARDRGEAILTRPVFLVQETEKDRQKGMLMYMPVYRHNTAVATMLQRRDALEGYVYSPIRMKDFMNGTFPKPPTDVGFQIYTDIEAKPASLLFDSVSAWNIKLPHRFQSDLETVRSVQRFGHTWLFSFKSLPAFAAEQRKGQSRAYLIAGLVVSILLTTIAFMLRYAHAKAIAAGQALKESRERYRKISEESPAYIVTILPDGTLTYANPALANDWGQPQADLVGRNFFDFVLPDYREQVRQWLGSLVPVHPTTIHEEPLYGPDKSIVWHQWTNRAIFDDNGKVVEIQGVGQDITARKQAEEERERLEQQMMHAQKMESLGILAGGVAHDFNNILMAIIGNVDLSLMKVSDDSGIVVYLRNIEKAANRAADLAKQMLAYSGKGKFVIEQLDINRLVEEMKPILEASLPDNATLEVKLQKPLAAIEGDANQMRQILMNLFMNATEAVGEKGGDIVISTTLAEQDRESLKDFLLGENMTEGDYVVLEVLDTGSGMEREVLGKIFDPFFTTKFTGRGLGLAALHGIVRGHRGGIKVQSEPGRGSIFKVLLPASRDVVAVQEKEFVEDGWKGEGKVLLVDDEEAVRNVASELLRELGYVAVTAGDGTEAIERFQENRDVQAVILDLTMPRMDGEQCFRELRLLDPAVKVIMSSGFSERDIAEKFAGQGLAGFVHKPYTLKELREVLRKM